MKLQFEKIGLEKITATCTQWDSFPTPGYYIRFTKQAGNHFYVRIRSVKPLEQTAHTDDADTTALGLVLEPAAGTVDIRITQSELLSPQQYYQSQYPAADSAHYHLPLKLGQLTVDLAQCGRVIYVKPHYNGMHTGVLQALQQHHNPLVIVDPVGMRLPIPNLKTLTLGLANRLTIQDVGVSRFITWVTETFPPGLQARALECLFSLMPPHSDFLPLSYFIGHPALKDNPLGPAILQRLNALEAQGLFANYPDERLIWPESLQGAIRLDVSHIDPDMLEHAYEGLIQSILSGNLPQHTRIAFIAPELATETLSDILPQFRYDTVLISNVQSPQWDATLITDRLEAATLMGESGIRISGDWTHGIDVFMSDADIKEHGWPPPILPPADITAPETPDDAMTEPLGSRANSSEIAYQDEVLSIDPADVEESQVSDLSSSMDMTDERPVEVWKAAQDDNDEGDTGFDLSLDSDLMGELGLEPDDDETEALFIPVELDSQDPDVIVEAPIQASSQTPEPVPVSSHAHHPPSHQQESPPVYPSTDIDTPAHDYPEAVGQEDAEKALDFSFALDIEPSDLSVEPDGTKKDYLETIPTPVQQADLSNEPLPLALVDEDKNIPVNNQAVANDEDDPEWSAFELNWEESAEVFQQPQPLNVNPVLIATEENLAVEKSFSQEDADAFTSLNTQNLAIDEPQPLAVEAPSVSTVNPRVGSAQYQSGEQVFHKRYGRGVVQRVMAMDGHQVILNIQFDTAGKRLLDPKLTELEKVG